MKISNEKTILEKKIYRKNNKGLLASEYVLSYEKTWWNFYRKKLPNRDNNF
jgi:hypothetical protein